MVVTRWVVTGGCGFIGSALVRALVRNGDCVTVVDDLSVGTPESLEAGIDLVEPAGFGPDPGWTPGRVRLFAADVRDPRTARHAVHGADVIAHLAARTGVDQSVAEPLPDLWVNVLGTVAYLEAAREAGVPRFLFASSGAPVGSIEPPLHERVPCRPVSPYGASKLAGEGYCSAYFHSFGVETVALRFGNVYGPGSSHKGSVVARFIRRARAGLRLEIHGSGDQTRDFVYVDDLVEALLAASRAPGVGGEVFQIATEQETTVRELAELLCAVLTRHRVEQPEVAPAPARVGDVARSYACTEAARARLGWRARTSLSEGLERTVCWFLDTNTGHDVLDAEVPPAASLVQMGGAS